MNQSLIFIPDISGFTQFVQTTEAEHSQHVIAELLEILINANTQNLKLAEVEGDALFFFADGRVPSQEKILAQIETMFTAFYSHLELLKKHRICPCNACASAPNLDLKIILHCGELQFLQVQGNHKPFGNVVIESHRLLKNSVDSDQYVLISSDLANHIGMPDNYSSKLFNFKVGHDEYDQKDIRYLFSEISTDALQLRPFEMHPVDNLPDKPNLTYEFNFDVSAQKVYETITNFKFRPKWVKGVDHFEYNPNEVNRVGSEHVCVINEKHLNFKTVTKPGEPGQLVYGELTESIPIADELYQFYLIRHIDDSTCAVKIETYWRSKSLFKKLMMAIAGKKEFQKNIMNGMSDLKIYLEGA